jgi:hypothetical protein
VGADPPDSGSVLHQHPSPRTPQRRHRDRQKPVRERVLRPKRGWISLSVNGTITSEHIDELMHETFGGAS